MSVEIFIARHGQNEDNVNGVLNGHRDLPLTDLGKSQAQALADGIQKIGLKFDAVYCSPLSRALETAKIVCASTGHLSPIVYEELIERDFGVMTGKPANDIEKLCYPDIVKTDTITYFLSPKGAETFPDLIERSKRVLNLINTEHKSGKVLLVCHGDIGKMIYTAATDKQWRSVLTDFHFGNGDLIAISGHGEAHKIKLPQYNN